MSPSPACHLPAPAAAPSAQREPGLGAWWLALRWLLVALLVLDQVSAPWHTHVHDAAGGTASSGYSGAQESTPHLEKASAAWQHHGLAALRLQTRPLLMSALAQTSDLPALGLALWPAPVFGPAPGQIARPSFKRQLDRRPSHRSLPPDGRAPPQPAIA